jgi:hypothetical protein
MIRKLTASAVWCVLLLSPVLAIYRLTVIDISHTDWDAVIQHGVFTSRFIQFMSVVVILFAWLLTMGSFVQGIRLRRRRWYEADRTSVVSMCGVALAGFLTLGSQNATEAAKSQPSGVELRTIVSPVMAGMAALHAIRKVQSRDEEAGKDDAGVMVFERSEHLPMLAGVAVIVDHARVSSQWEVIVRMFGHPQVEDRNGNVAEFRKRKSLELLTWLSINRDRPLRSTARTAMWESDISDSSFATIVSDMRRGLSDLCPHVSAREWSPPTFTDEIVLSSQIITDVELMSDAFRRFQSDPQCAAELITELSHIRDIPFAATNYQWPDVDGCTTRFIILGVNAAREVAYWAYENKDWTSVTIAVTAGLRLIPGDEELLDLQRLVLQASSRGLH